MTELMQRKTKIKLCGMMREQDIEAANLLCPEYIALCLHRGVSAM